jgi:hypothetical protein
MMPKKIREPFAKFLLVLQNGQTAIARQKGRTLQIFDLDMPKPWIKFVRKWGKSRAATIYPMPRLMQDWVLFKCVKDEPGARSAARKIELWLATLGEETMKTAKD